MLKKLRKSAAKANVLLWKALINLNHELIIDTQNIPVVLPKCNHNYCCKRNKNLQCNLHSGNGLSIPMVNINGG